MNSIHSIKTSRYSDNGNRVEALIEIGATTHEIFFQCKTEQLAPNPNAFITASLLPSMKVGGTIAISEPGVSLQFSNTLSTIQDIYCSWQPKLNRVKLISDEAPTPLPQTTSKRVGSFFSGGMDSFYTLLKHQECITDLIFVHGFDIALSDTKLRDITVSRLQKTADALGKNLIIIETNLRELTNPYARWDMAHGPALATIGQLLHNQLNQLFIPATFTYAELFPCGSHPVLDPLWSTESLNFIHDGCEATRVNKAKWIAQSDVALNNLRVCWQNPNGAYNCGECEKCIRTMINLLINNALDRCTTFSSPLTPRKVARINAKKESVRNFMIENLTALESVEGTDAIRKALKRSIRRSSKPISLKRILKNFN